MEIVDNTRVFSTVKSKESKVFHKHIHNIHSLWEKGMWKKAEADIFLQNKGMAEKSEKTEVHGFT